MKTFINMCIFSILTSCASSKKQESYHDRMRNSKDKPTKESAVIDLKFPLIWYVEKF